jgi:hypothetical protein
MYTGLHVKCFLFLSICNKIDDVLKNFFKIFKFEIKIKKRIHMVDGVFYSSEGVEIIGSSYSLYCY